MFTITLHCNGKIGRTPYYRQPPPPERKQGEWMRDFYVQDGLTFRIAALSLVRLFSYAINDDMKFDVAAGLHLLDWHFRTMVHGEGAESDPRREPVFMEFLDRVSDHRCSADELEAAVKWWESEIKKPRAPVLTLVSSFPF